MADEHHERTERSEHDEQLEKLRRRRNIRLGVLLGLGLVVILLGVDNSHDVQMEYLVGEAQFPLVWVILGSLIAGAILERAYAFVRGRPRRRDGD